MNDESESSRQRRDGVPTWLIVIALFLATLLLIASVVPEQDLPPCLTIAYWIGSRPRNSLPTTTIRIGNKTFELEIANLSQTRETGLMRRDGMPSDHGMIFVFAGEETRYFYMRNTRFPLDIVFVDGRGRIISIHQMKPYDESNTSSDGAAKWAIELNEGAAAAAGAKLGDQLEIPAEAAKSADGK